MSTNPASRQPRSVALYRRKDNPQITQALQRTRRYLEKAGLRVMELNEVGAGREADLVIAFGGDGSLLHAARSLAPHGVPVLGVNFGRIGYLCTVNAQHLEPALEDLLRGRYRLERRNMIQCQVWQEGQLLWQAQALNEVLVGGCNRTVSLEVHIDDIPFGAIRGDGLILATKTGSTAYSFSAGGPVLMIEDALCLVASNAVFSSSIRSLVLPIETHLRLRNLTSGAQPFVVADGQNDLAIAANAEVLLGRSPYRASFIELGHSSPYSDLHRSFQELMVRELNYHPQELS